MQNQKTLTIVVLLIIVIILVFSLTPRVAFADPIQLGPNLYEIQGAHVVSEGAYFRFLVVNHDSDSIYVTVNDGDLIYIPVNGSANYNVIAPQISVPYEVVTYTFRVYSTTPQRVEFRTIDFPVTVVSSSFIGFVVVTDIIIAIGLFVVLFAFIIWYKRLFSGQVKLDRTEARDLRDK